MTGRMNKVFCSIEKQGNMQTFKIDTILCILKKIFLICVIGTTFCYRLLLFWFNKNEVIKVLFFCSFQQSVKFQYIWLTLLKIYLNKRATMALNRSPGRPVFHRLCSENIWMREFIMNNSSQLMISHRAGAFLAFG